ncbi:TNF receptor-associated factor 5 [Geodia barretti]|uniref:TNF receptor-associated factor 5 n=1 Tax=Geodia barretti TaxID=519541 RepID=A0AA35U152_GEOBA|nr:TNF receptor-associated factor 5 [Geodia barretti]
MAAKVYSNGVQLKEAELMTLMCPACNGLLRDPVQVTACGDRFCQSCIDRLMRNNKAPYKCPVDGTEFKRHEVRKDRGCLKELQRLEIECTTKPTSCGWRGPLPNLEAHLAECPTVEVRCSLGCGKHVLKSQLSTHVSSQCPNRPTHCNHCNTSVPIQNLENHEDKDNMPSELCLSYQASAVQNTQCHEVKSAAVCSRSMRVPGQCNPSVGRSASEILQLLERMGGRCGQLNQCSHTDGKLSFMSRG